MKRSYAPFMCLAACAAGIGSANASDFDLNDLQLKRVYIEASGGKVRTKDNYAVGDYGWAAGGRVGMDATLPEQFVGGLSFLTVHSAGNGSFGTEQTDEQRNSYGPSGYLQRHVWGPFSLGVTGSYLWMKGRNLSNQGAQPGINKFDEFSHQTSWSIYAPVLLPLTSRRILQAAPAFSRSEVSAHFTAIDPGVQSSSLSVFNLVTIASYQSPWNVHLDFGAVAHRALSQGQPGTTPTHSLMWMTPLVGASYEFAPRWTVYGRASMEAFDRAYDSWTITSGIARSF
jgi:hypothetical protein